MSQRHWKEQRIQDPWPPEPNYKDDDQTTRPDSNRVSENTNRSERGLLTGHRKQSISLSDSCKCCVIIGQQWIRIETKLNKGIACKSYKIEECTNNDKYTKLSPIRIFEQIIAGIIIIIDKTFIFHCKLRYLYYGMRLQ